MAYERIIGSYTGPEKGPLLICFAGMHGNEPAGVEALEIVFSLLELEPDSNPDFLFRGRMLGIKGNLPALKKKVRFIKKDLNRMWRPEFVQRMMATAVEQLQFEEREMRDILQIVHEEIASYQPELIVVLDLHTTTADGGIFSIATDDPESVRLAIEFHAPVIKGLLHGLQGTVMHYFNDHHFEPRTISVTFEAGQHDDPLSVNRSIAAIINCMRSAGNVKAEHVENRHDKLLIDYAKGLPKVAELILRHEIGEEDQFEMMPNYHNFQAVEEGEILARDRKGEIKAVADGLILMPLYQSQGDDGFFLIRSLEGW